TFLFLLTAHPSLVDVSDDSCWAAQVAIISLIVSAFVQYSTGESLSSIDSILTSVLVIMLGQSIVLNNGKWFGLPSLKQLRKLQLYSKKFFYRLLATISNISTAVMGIFAWLRVRECGRENEYFVMLGYNITLSSRGLQ
ncbi:hypothetical protein FRC09_007592, partial [Ceratobasidium sp. 395]